MTGIRNKRLSKYTRLATSETPKAISVFENPFAPSNPPLSASIAIPAIVPKIIALIAFLCNAA